MGVGFLTEDQNGQRGFGLTLKIDSTWKIGSKVDLTNIINFENLPSTVPNQLDWLLLYRDGVLYKTQVKDILSTVPENIVEYEGVSITYDGEYVVFTN